MKNVAVIGSGYWGKNLVRNFSALGALNTVCDRNTEALDAFRKQYKDLKAVLDIKEVLEDRSVSAVAIATPAELHYSMARDALLAGKDVFVEKPLCLSEEEGADLINLAGKGGRILMVGHLLWYHPAVMRLKELVEKGELGRIQYVYSSRLNLGKIRREENILWSFAPHDISIVLGLLNEMPCNVQGHGGSYLHEMIADVTVSLLAFPSGVKAHFFVSWLHPFKQQKMIIVGDRKMAVFDDVAPWPEKLTLYPHQIEWRGNVPVPSKAEAEAVEIEEAEPLRAECSHFLESVASRKPPRTDGREGLRVLQVLNACQRAIEDNCSVSLEQDSSDSSRDFFVHETAVIDDKVRIGKGTRIWHFSHILGGSIIGAECTIGQNVVIGPDVEVGKGCKIQNNVSLYQGVSFGEGVFCGPSAVFTNVINPRSHIVRKHEFQETPVGEGATIGANATIVCGHRIGRYAFIGAGAVVTRDVPDNALMVGNPARQTGWVCRCGSTLPLSPGAEGEASCGECGTSYSSDGQILNG